MSLATWSLKYYPTTARQCAETQDKTLPELRLMAAKHSLKKWEGVTPENMEAHGLSRTYALELVDKQGECLTMYDDTCALCQLSKDQLKKSPNWRTLSMCIFCPLFEARGAKCYDPIDGEDDSPWHQAMRHHRNVKPMIALLKKTVKQERLAVARLKAEGKEPYTAASVGVSDT